MATTNTTDTALSNITLIGKCEETEDSSYDRKTPDGTLETIHKIQLSRAIAGMQERLHFELPEEVIPSTDLLSQWELEETWLVVSANSMRAFGFTRFNARPGERATSAFVVFTGSSVREASSDKRKQLQAARKAQKTVAKQRHAAHAAEKAAQKSGEKEAAQETASAPAQQSA